MFENFCAELADKLINQGFEPIKGFSDSVNSKGEIKCLAFLNTSAPVWYGFTLINTSNFVFAEFQILKDKLTKFYEDIQSETGIKKIIAINLFVCDENLEQGYNSILEADSFISDEQILNVYWKADVKRKKLQAGKGNPDKILNLQDIVKNSFSEGAYLTDEENIPININQLFQKAAEKRPKMEPQSSDYAFTYIMMAVNLIIWVIMEFNGGSKNTANLVRFGAITPTLFPSGEYYRLFNSMFLHIGFTHLLSNCLGLFIFATRVEKYFGKIKFLLIYIFSGLMGGLFSALFTAGVAAGASGGIFGLVGGIFAATSKTKLSMEGLNKSTVSMYIGYSIIFGFMRAEIDNFGHIGGLLGGILLGYILYPKRKEAV